MALIMERILRFGRVSVLYDPERLETPDPEWFNPEWWAARDGIRARFGGRGEALAVADPLPPAVLRPYRRGGLARHLSRGRYLYTGLDRSRPWREWRITRELWMAGLPVPQPLAAALRRRGRTYSAALLTARIPDARPLSAGTRDLDPDAWRALGRTLTDFTAAGVMHADLNAGNILRDAAGRYWLLDFDRATLHDRALPTETPLKRLLRSFRKLELAVDEAALREGIGG